MLVNRSNYIIKEFPKFNPFSIDYINFWKEQKYLCLYGMWSCGMWIPGPLYHYINMWHIELKEKDDSKNASIGRPWFRDVEYDFYIAYSEARGFSRFENQTLEEIKGKTPRDIMQASYLKPMGRPLFENDAKNMVMVTARGAGKSFMVANLIAYEFLHSEKKNDTKQVSVGASLAKYSDELLSKVKLGLEHLPGAMEYKGEYFPPPFYKKYRGTWKSGDYIEAKYRVLKGRNEIWKGCGSRINHTTFQAGAFKSLGSRPVLSIKEEAGEFPNLETTWNADMHSLMNGDRQFGTQIGIGTGGNMKSGTVDLKKIFYNPESYNLVAFEDKYDNTHGKIGLFFPVTMGMNSFKDENGNTKYDEALENVMTKRKKIFDSGSPKQVIEQELQFRPLKPSESFLISGSNIFPKDELLNQLSKIETDEAYKNMASVGRIDINESGNPEFVLDPLKYEIIKFPLEIHDDAEGAIVIWEHPVENPPYGLYICGIDPYDHDKSQTGSLGSAIVYKRFLDAESTYDLPVAEYTGRPETADDYYENIRRLLLLYNARALYENERKGIHQYFSFRDCTHLLIDQPAIIDDIIKNSKVDRKKGIHMTVGIKEYAEQRIKKWMLEEYAPGHKNIEKIYSRGLLKELIDYNDQGNFDRCLFEETKIFTKDGYKNVESLTLEDKVLTHLGRYKEITCISKHRPTNDCYSIEIKGEYESLQCTGNHPIYSFKLKRKGVKKSLKEKRYSNIIKEFIPAENLTKEHFVLRPKRINLKKSKFEDDLLYLMGWYLADGNVNIINGKIRICLQYNQEKIADKLISIIEKYTEGQTSYVRNSKRNRGVYFYKANKITKARKIMYPNGKRMINVEKTSKWLANLLAKHCGGPNKKQLSNYLFDSYGLLPLAIGYLEGDGHQKKFASYDGYKREVIECCAIYEIVTKQIRQILIDNGIWSSVCIKNISSERKIQYNLTISRKYINKIAEGSFKFNVVNDISVFSKDSAIETEEGFWLPVKNVNKIESPKYVYNFSVKDDETYVASNIVTHNCIAFMMVMIFRDEVHKRLVKKKEDETIKNFFNIKLFTEKPNFY